MKKFVNGLCIYRAAAGIAIVPAMVFGLFSLAAVLFITGAVSDFFDGYLARKYQVTSKLGGVMDQISDKIIVAVAVMMVMVYFGTWWIVVPGIFIILRELYVSGLREWLGSMNMAFPVPSPRFSLGKIKTTVQMIALSGFFITIAMAPIYSIGYEFKIKLLDFSVICFWTATIFSLLSATQYTMRIAEKLKGKL